jgi:hypothetical protein
VGDGACPRAEAILVGAYSQLIAAISSTIPFDMAGAQHGAAAPAFAWPRVWAAILACAAALPLRALAQGTLVFEDDFTSLADSFAHRWKVRRGVLSSASV